MIDVLVRAFLFGFAFWFCWTRCELGATYFCFLPPVYQSVPFWHCVGLAVLAGIPRCLLARSNRSAR
jgi:RsiW-degrading membrane proteinase PrsW (M82 family)